jgi:hypothetical protein
MLMLRMVRTPFFGAVSSCEEHDILEFTNNIDRIHKTGPGALEVGGRQVEDSPDSRKHHEVERALGLAVAECDDPEPDVILSGKVDKMGNRKHSESGFIVGAGSSALGFVEGGKNLNVLFVGQVFFVNCPRKRPESREDGSVAVILAEQPVQVLDNLVHRISYLASAGHAEMGKVLTNLRRSNAERGGYLLGKYPFDIVRPESVQGASVARESRYGSSVGIHNVKPGAILVNGDCCGAGIDAAYSYRRQILFAPSVTKL